MKITVHRPYQWAGMASRDFEIQLVRSLGKSDEDFGEPAILIRLTSGKQGIFAGEFAVNESTVEARIGKCLAGTDLFV